MYGIFSSRTYDSLDPIDESFIKDYERFKTRTFELVKVFELKVFDLCFKAQFLMEKIIYK